MFPKVVAIQQPIGRLNEHGTRTCEAFVVDLLPVCKSLMMTADDIIPEIYVGRLEFGRE